MKGHPTVDAGLVTHEQSLEAIEPHVGVFDRGAAAVEFGVKAGVVVVLSLVGPQVTGNVGVDVPRGASLTQCVGNKGAVSVEERLARAMLAALSSTLRNKYPCW